MRVKPCTIIKRKKFYGYKEMIQKDPNEAEDTDYLVSLAESER